MARPLPPLDLLIGFEAAARNLSFSKAGEEIFLTQSAISRQIKKLEDYLGAALFERQPRTLALTPQGQLLFEATTTLLKDFSSALHHLRDPGHQATIKIATSPAIATLWLLPRMPQFNQFHPDISIHLSTSDISPHSMQSDIDIVIEYYTKDNIPDNSLSILAQEEVFPVCSPKLIQHHGQPLNMVSDLMHYNLIHLDDVSAKNPWLKWEKWFDLFDYGNFLIKNTLMFSHIDQVIQAACMGQGVALGTSPLVNRLLRDGILIAPLKERVISPNAMHLLRGMRHSQYIDIFSKWIIKEALYP